MPWPDGRKRPIRIWTPGDTDVEVRRVATALREGQVRTLLDVHDLVDGLTHFEARELLSAAREYLWHETEEQARRNAMRARYEAYKRQQEARQAPSPPPTPRPWVLARKNKNVVHDHKGRWASAGELPTSRKELILVVAASIAARPLRVDWVLAELRRLWPSVAWSEGYVRFVLSKAGLLGPRGNPGLRGGG